MMELALAILFVSLLHLAYSWVRDDIMKGHERRRVRVALRKSAFDKDEMALKATRERDKKWN